MLPNCEQALREATDGEQALCEATDGGQTLCDATEVMTGNSATVNLQWLTEACIFLLMKPVVLCRSLAAFQALIGLSVFCLTFSPLGSLLEP
jgi:hypothetical protein